MSRELTDEIFVRIAKVDKLISNWMHEKSIPEIDPEGCMHMLVEQGVYPYDSKGKAHYLREDLRTLRDCGRIDTFESLKIEQKVPGSRWFISLFTKNNVAQ